MIKKSLNLLIMSALLVLGASCVLADGSVFEPDMNGYSYIQTPAVAQKQSSQTQAQVQPQQKAQVQKTTKITTEEVGQRENANFQRAILELDSAQVGIRTSLIDLKTQYTDVNDKYVLVKNQRKDLQKSIRTTEKRIKDIEKTKEKLRKEII